MKTKLDTGLLLTVVALMGIGLVQVYSSSYIFAIESYGDGLYFFKRQLLFALIAVFVLFGVASIPWKFIEKFGWALWAAAACLVMITFGPGVGIRVGGALRWIQMPFGFRLQPGELLNISFSLLFATYLCRQQEFLKNFKWPVRLLSFCIPLLFLLKQPDFGTFTIIMLVCGSLFFAFGLKWRYIVTAVSVALPSFYFLVMNVPYRRARVLAFLDPWADPAQKGFQVIQSMLSFHSGGLTGVGLGQGQGKLFFLPEAHTDFTLSVLAEEIGFFGFFMVLMLYAFVVLRGFQIALGTENKFRRTVALGLSMTFALAVFINAGVTMGLLPTKGLALPFLSYGGSSLVNLCIMFGILLNIDRANRFENTQKSYSILK